MIGLLTLALVAAAQESCDDSSLLALQPSACNAKVEVGKLDFVGAPPRAGKSIVVQKVSFQLQSNNLRLAQAAVQKECVKPSGSSLTILAQPKKTLHFKGWLTISGRVQFRGGGGWPFSRRRFVHMRKMKDGVWAIGGDCRQITSQCTSSSGNCLLACRTPEDFAFKIL